MTPEHESVKMSPEDKAKKFVSLEKRYIVLPPDDVNLPLDLFIKRRQRILQTNDSGFIKEMGDLLNDAPISDFFKKQILHEERLMEAVGWTSWDEIEDTTLESSYGISLKKKKYGFFDPEQALAVEAKFYHAILLLLEVREENGQFNPVSHREWGKDLTKRVIEHNFKNGK